MSNKSTANVATMGIDIGKNSAHVVGLDQRGAIVLRQKWSRNQAAHFLQGLGHIRTRAPQQDASARRGKCGGLKILGNCGTACLCL